MATRYMAADHLRGWHALALFSLELTPREAQIARLAWDGPARPEISTQLFISPRLAGWHLRTVVAKLGIGSCGELRQVLPGLAGVAGPA